MRAAPPPPRPPVPMSRRFSAPGSGSPFDDVLTPLMSGDRHSGFLPQPIDQTSVGHVQTADWSILAVQW